MYKIVSNYVNILDVNKIFNKTFYIITLRL